MLVRLPIGLQVEEKIVTEVEIKELDGFARQILSDKELRRNAAKLTSAVLKHVLVSIDGKPATENMVREMYTADRNTLMIDLQKLSIGNEVKARYNCSWCPEGFEVIEDLSELEFIAEDVHQSDITVMLPNGYKDKDGNIHTEVTMGLPTGIDEEILAPMLQNNYGTWTNSLIARKITAFGSLDMAKFAGLGIKIVQSLGIKDLDVMISALVMNMPGYQVKHKVICPACAKDTEQVLDMQYFF